jgi:hypothetical protein
MPLGMRITQESVLKGSDSSIVIKRCQKRYHIRFEIFCQFASCLIDLLNDFNNDFQACAGLDFSHQLFDQSDTGKDHSLTGAGHMRE